MLHKLSLELYSDPSAPFRGLLRSEQFQRNNNIQWFIIEYKFNTSYSMMTRYTWNQLQYSRSELPEFFLSFFFIVNTRQYVLLWLKPNAVSTILLLFILYYYNNTIGIFLYCIATWIAHIIIKRNLGVVF